MPLIEAVSGSGLLEQVGTIAGIAAALISAVLAALVLGQGREIRRVRDELHGESERARQAEASLTAELAGARQAVQAPVAAAAVPLAAPAVASASVPSDSTGEWAVEGASSINSSAMPALGSATAAPAIAAFAEAPRLLHETVAERPVAAEPPIAVAAPPRPAPIVIPAPAPVASAAAAAAVGSSPLGAPSTPAAGGISRSPKPPAEAPRRRSVVPRVLGGVALLAVVIFGVIWFAGSGGDTPQKTTATTPTSTPGQGAIVSVLNGTPVAGLAGQVAAELSRDGFKRGRVATARDQQQPKTVVAYMPGHLTDAEAVVQSLKLGGAPVPADDPTQAIACPDPATCNVEVIVTVGADRTQAR